MSTIVLLVGLPLVLVVLLMVGALGYAVHRHPVLDHRGADRRADILVAIISLIVKG
ncbi:hypothetical protein ABZ915_34630 [Streptomyces sp. NPDC046915]|uniref:hypothetical protein n=1 Tax=Streptomyces sp. NPDC046915 TaxID=3155257 RepID=UPI0033D716D4